MSNQWTQPSPSLFFDTINAYQRSAVLKAAIQFNLFTIIGRGKPTAKDLAVKCKTSERGMRILCDYLVVIGFLIKKRQHYSLTPDSAVFLDQRSPEYIG